MSLYEISLWNCNKCEMYFYIVNVLYSYLILLNAYYIYGMYTEARVICFVVGRWFESQLWQTSCKASLRNSLDSLTLLWYVRVRGKVTCNFMEYLSIYLLSHLVNFFSIPDLCSKLGR